MMFLTYWQKYALPPAAQAAGLRLGDDRCDRLRDGGVVLLLRDLAVGEQAVQHVDLALLGDGVAVGFAVDAVAVGVDVEPSTMSIRYEFGFCTMPARVAAWPSDRSLAATLK